MSNGFFSFDSKPNGASQHVVDVKRVTWTGLLINLVLSIVKFIAGFLGNSQAVVADAVHTLSDSTTDIAILIGVRYWSQPPDDSHPYGHRRIETMITALIGFILASVAIGLLYNALATIREGGHSSPGWIAFFAALLSVIVKEFLCRWTLSIGKRIKSSAITANALHHRSDALSSCPAALAVLGAAISPTWSFLDHIGALVVSLFILQTAWAVAWPALKQLTDAGASQADQRRIELVALDTDGVQVVHAVRTRHIGSGLQVDLHILVDGNLTVREGHDISEIVKRRLVDQGPDVVDVVVHLEPFEDNQP